MKKYINTFIFMFTFLMLSISPIKAVELPTIHLDKTVINFTDNNKSQDINFYLERNSSSDTTFNYEINATSNGLIDLHNSNNKINTSFSYTNKTNTANLSSTTFTNDTAGKINASIGSVTKAGEYLGTATVNLDISNIKHYLTLDNNYNLIKRFDNTTGETSRASWIISNNVVTETSKMEDGFFYSNIAFDGTANDYYHFKVDTSASYGFCSTNCTDNTQEVFVWSKDTADIISLNPGAYTEHDEYKEMLSKDYIFKLDKTKEYIFRFDVNKINTTDTFSNLWISDIDKLPIDDETTIADIPIPEREGYIFDGWYTTATGGEKLSNDTKITNSITLYAHWNRIHFDVNVFVDGVHIDATSYSGELKNSVKYDAYINGELVAENTPNYSTYLKIGDTYEIKNITFDEEHYEQLSNYVGYESLKSIPLKGTITKDTFNNESNYYIGLDIGFKKRKVYNIDYELDGGLAVNKIEYTNNSDTFTLLNPVKQGYEFLGWTVGKNLYSFEDLEKSAEKPADTSRMEYDTARTVLDVKPNTYYTLSTNLPKRPDGGTYMFLKGTNDFNDYMYTGSDGALINSPRTVKSTSDGHILIGYAKYESYTSIWESLKNGDYWFQLEEGDEPTSYEAYISTPAKNIIISKGSEGNRTYIANWVKKGVYAKLYDTTGDGKGDTLILNNHPYFTHEGTLITDYDDKDSMNERQWTSSADITKVKILDEIKPNSTKSWFQSLTNLTSIEGLEKLNTVNVTNMYNMFYNCKNIEEIDVSHFNTSKVTNMQGMFGECNKVKILDVSNWDTSNVENMSVMFQNAKALTTLDVSNFNTSKVKSMSCMFQNVTNLTTLDVSHFDTSNVESMGYMFYGDKSLTTLDVSNFDTSKTTTMIGMFKSVSSVTTLDVSNFNTSNVTNMYEMFRYMDNVEELKVDDFDTSKVTTMYAMFGSLANITSLNLSNWDTSNVTDMYSMFTMWDGRTNDWNTMTPKLETIIFGDKFDTSKVTNMEDMFSGQRTIKVLDLYSFNTSSLEKATHMFNQTDNLKTIYAKDWDTSKLTDTSVMFWANSLKGGNGTEFSTSHTDESYARQDLHHQAGYFTSKDEYKITYNSDGGTLASDVWRRYFKEDLDYDIPTPTKSGYNFLGWTIGKNLYIRENTAFTSFGITTTTNSDNSYHFSGTYTGTERWFNLEDDKYKHTLSAGTYTLSTDLSSDFRLVIKLKKSNGSIHEFYAYKDNPVTFTIDGTEHYYMWISRVNNGQYYNMDVKIQLEEGKKNTSYESYISEPTLNISIPKGREGNRTYDAHYEEIIGVFSKLYDTTGDGKGDTLVLNNTQNFTYEGTLIDDYENEDSTSIGQWTASSDIKTVKILNEIKPASTWFWFNSFTGLTSIEGIEKINTSNVINMMYMFSGCSSLTELDLSSWDMSNVINISSMFMNCSALTNLNISGWNTSKVTNISNIFQRCSSLTSLDLSSWDVSNVTTMGGIFHSCSSLTEINLNGWDTSKVTTMNGMFYENTALKTIYVSNSFNTNSVTTSNYMFYSCTNLVGGNGTTYNGVYDKTYARIDTATTPGYFTAKN